MTLRLRLACLRLGTLVAGLALAAGASGARAAGVPPGAAGTAANELARKVANPVASLVSVPLQVNFDDGIGPFDTRRTTLNLQPVVPVSLGPASPVRLISRTVVPFVQAEGGPVFEDLSGLGDVTQSLFVANARPLGGGWTVGLGPVLQLPTGTDARLSTDRWSVGPTAIVVRQSGQWTWGALANHLWSVAGEARGPGISTTFVQPFINYIAPTHTTLALNTEASRDWTSRTWSVPIHVIVNQIIKVGPQPMSVFVGARGWAQSPESGPEGFGWRFGTTLLFPSGRPGAAGARP